MDIRKPQQPIRGNTNSRLGAKPLRAKQVDPKKAKKTENSIFGSLIVVVIICTMVVALLTTKKLFITNIEVSGARTEYNSEIKKYIEKSINGKYLFVLPKQNIIIYPERSLTNKIFTDFTNIDQIVLERKGLNALNVIIHERVPVFYVVDNGVEAGIYIDNIGTIFKDKNRLLLGSTSSTAISETSNAYTSTSSLALPINFNNKIGTTFEANQFAHIIKLVDTLNKKNIKVRSVLLRPYSDADIVITDEGGSLRVNLDSDPEKLIVNFNAIRKTEPFKTQFLENRPRLHYVDLRFGNKVFYKFSGTGTTTNETKL